MFDLFFSLPAPKEAGAIAEKGRKKAADRSFLVTDFDLV